METDTLLSDLPYDGPDDHEDSDANFGENDDNNDEDCYEANVLFCRSCPGQLLWSLKSFIVLKVLGWSGGLKGKGGGGYTYQAGFMIQGCILPLKTSS